MYKTFTKNKWQWLTPPRWRFMMRVHLILSILVLTTAQLLPAFSGLGQELDKAQVSVEMNDEPLANIFYKIENQSSYLFSYVDEIVQYDGITLSKQKRSIKETLDLAFKGLPLGYKTKGNHILIYKKHADANAPAYQGAAPEAEASASMTVVPSVVSRATADAVPVFTVRGTITESTTGEPMPGVNVLVKNTSRGTTSDSEGKYVLDVEASDVLVFSFIGYETQEVSVNARTVIDLGLVESKNQLEEVPNTIRKSHKEVQYHYYGYIREKHEDVRKGVRLPKGDSTDFKYLGATLIQCKDSTLAIADDNGFFKFTTNKPLRNETVKVYRTRTVFPKDKPLYTGTVVFQERQVNYIHIPVIDCSCWSFFNEVIELTNKTEVLHALYLDGFQYLYARSLYDTNSLLLAEINNAQSSIPEALKDEFKILTTHLLTWTEAYRKKIAKSKKMPVSNSVFRISYVGDTFPEGALSEIKDWAKEHCCLDKKV